MTRGYLTSRAGIYAAPRTLRPGQKYSREGLAAILRRAGYVESDEASEIWNGSFSQRDDAVEICPNNSGGDPSVIKIVFNADGRIGRLVSHDLDLGSLTLAPESLTSDAANRGGAHAQLSFKDIPPVLVHAITAIEDRRFFEHHGVDLFGVARAILRNAGD